MNSLVRWMIGRTQLADNHKSSLLAKVATATRPLPKLWTSLFRGIAWPYIELAFRLWIAKLFGFFGFMQMLHWETTLAVAGQENPIPFLAPNSAAFLSTAICCETAGCETSTAAVSIATLSSREAKRSNTKRRVGSASAFKITLTLCEV